MSVCSKILFVGVFTMKKCIGLLLPVVLITMNTDNDKAKKICHTWIQYAYKPFGQPEEKTIPYTKRTEFVFKSNGTYVRYDFDGRNAKMTSDGKWIFNYDQTKLGFAVITWKGIKRPEYPNPIETSVVILKLTNDTLIFGRESYYDKAGHGSKLYIRDDSYFVRKK